MSKTPRTLLENYIDAAKTQTIKVTNKRAALVQTPELHFSPGKNLVKSHLPRSPGSPFRSQQHKHGSNTGMRLSRTPEPYMSSAAKSRPQHDRVASLRSKRRSIPNSEPEETPRQLLQGFLESEDTTAPLVRYTRRTSQGRLSSSQPAIPVGGWQSSGPRSANWTVDMESDTPRTLLQKYVLNTSAIIETPAPRQSKRQQATPKVPLKQDTYHTPSPFKTSSTASEGLDEVVMVNRSRGKTPRSSKKGNFSIGTIEGINQTVDESVIPPTNPEDYKVPSPFCSSSSDEDSFVAETTFSSTHTYNRSQHQKGKFHISVPDSVREEILQQQRSERPYREELDKTGNWTGNFEYEGVREQEKQGTRQDYFEHEGISDSEDEQSYEKGTRMVDLEKQPGTSMLPDSREYTMPLKDNEMHTSPIISYQRYHNTSFPEDFIKHGNERDRQRMGRWSEGHRSRLGSPEDRTRSGQYDDGHRRSLPGSMVFPTEEQLSRHSSMSHSPRQLNEDGISTTEMSRRNYRSMSREVRERMSHGEVDRIVDVSPVRTYSHHEDLDEIYTAQRLEDSRQDEHQNRSILDIYGDFSPKVTSTQRAVTTGTDTSNNDRPLPTMTPSPVVSPNASPRSLTPASSRKSSSRVLTPSQRDNVSTSVSPASSVRSVSSRGSSRRSTSRTITQLQTLTGTPADRSRNMTPRSSGRKSRSEALSSPQTVTPSPGGSGIRESTSSLALKPSSRTPLQTPRQGSFRNTSERDERSRLSQNRSRSDDEMLQSLEGSPVVAGRKQAQDMITTLPNNTANFSPQVVSTQNMATLSHMKQNVTDRIHEEEHRGVPNDEDQWQEEMDTNQGDNIQKTQAGSLGAKDTSVKIKKKVVRKPRQKSVYSLPVNLVKKQFTHFAGLRVTKEAIEEVMKVSEKYWDNLAQDLEAYAKHAGRKQINMSDFELLFKRQGHVTERQSLKSLIEKYLPMEEREQLIPVARAGNRIEPKLR